MYNDNRTKGDNITQEIQYIKYNQRGRGMMIHLINRYVAILVFSFSLGLPSTLSSDARVKLVPSDEGEVLYEHSAEKQRIDATNTPPQPSTRRVFRQRYFEESDPEEKDIFNNKLPRNKIPRGTYKSVGVPRNAIPKGGIRPNKLPRNKVPRNKIERSPIERKPLERKGVPRNKIPRGTSNYR